MHGELIGEGLGRAAVFAVVACCGVPVLLAAGVAGAALWTTGLGLAGAAVVALGVVFYLRRRSSECEECRRLGTRAMHELEH
jgi:hypothetical protein